MIVTRQQWRESRGAGVTAPHRLLGNGTGSGWVCRLVHRSLIAQSNGLAVRQVSELSTVDDESMSRRSWYTAGPSRDTSNCSRDLSATVQNRILADAFRRTRRAPNSVKRSRRPNSPGRTVSSDTDSGAVLREIRGFTINTEALAPVDLRLRLSNSLEIRKRERRN